MVATSQPKEIAQKAIINLPQPSKQAFGAASMLTPELREKGRKTRSESIAFAKANLRSDFLDSGEWDRLAKERGIRLPVWSLRCTPGNMEKWIRRVGWSVTRYYEWSGDKTLKDFGKRNPLWSLRAFVGLLLEEKANA